MISMIAIRVSPTSTPLQDYIRRPTMIGLDDVPENRAVSMRAFLLESWSSFEFSLIERNGISFLPVSAAAHPRATW